MTLKELLHSGIQFVRRQNSNYQYKKWVREYDTITEKDVQIMQELISQFTNQITFSILMPVYNPKISHLTDAIESVLNQSYRNWELCIADDCSTNPNVKTLLEEYSKKYEQIKVVFREKNGHISEASNTALNMANGDFIGLLDQDDVLARHALFMALEYINEYPNAQLLFSDEDKIKSKNHRFDPYFKAGWNPDLFYGQNLISHLGIYRRLIVEKIGGFRKGFEGSQDFDLALRVIEKISRNDIIHIPHVLYHWRYHKNSTSSSIKSKSYASDAGIKSLSSHFERTGQAAKFSVNRRNYYNIYWSKPSDYLKISIVLLNEDPIPPSKLIDDLILKCSHLEFEIIILNTKELNISEHISKDARVNYININDKNSLTTNINMAIRKTSGKILFIINTKISVANLPIDHTVAQLSRSEIGVLGFRLSDSYKRTRNAGFIITKKGISSLFDGSYLINSGYMGKATIAQNVSAIGIECMATKRSLFDRIGGFDESYEQRYFDFDFSLAARGLGLRIITLPYVHLSFKGSFESSEYEPGPDWHYFLEKWSGTINSEKLANPNLESETNLAPKFSFPPGLGYSFRDPY